MQRSIAGAVRRCAWAGAAVLGALGGGAWAFAQASTPSLAVAPAAHAPGGLLTVSATVSGLVNPAPGATITFTVYSDYPSYSPEPCRLYARAFSVPAVLGGSSASATSPPFRIDARHTPEYLTVSYGGDASNPAVSTPCELLRVPPPLPITPAFVERVSAVTSPPRSHRLPHTFTTRGRIVPPTGHCAPGATPTAEANCRQLLCTPGDPALCVFPSPSTVCSGVVNVRLQRGGRTISSRDVAVHAPDCTYRSRVTFRSRRPGALHVRARFNGNAVLRPRSSAIRTVHIG